MDIVINPDGTVSSTSPTQLTNTTGPGFNTLASWGVVRVTAP